MQSPLSPENVTRHVLSNGLVVLVKENHSAASIVVRGRMLAGAVWENAKKAGVADFTASASNRGTARYSFRKLNEEFDRLGLRFGVSAGTDAAGFSGKCLTEDFDSLLGIAEEVLRYPTFPEKEVEKLRHQLITQRDLTQPAIGRIVVQVTRCADLLHLTQVHDHVNAAAFREPLRVPAQS